MSIDPVFPSIRIRKSGDGPASVLQTVSRWMQAVSPEFVYSAHGDMVRTLIQFNHAPPPLSRKRLRSLMHLDEQARELQHILCTQYLYRRSPSNINEGDLWASIHAFYWEATRGYHALLMDFVSNSGCSRMEPFIPLVTARALRGFADILKWRYIGNEQIDEKLWLRVHNLHRLAEFDRFQGDALKLYNHDPGESSCTNEYVQALLLAPLGRQGLAPRQIEMVDDWLDRWSPLVRFEAGLDARLRGNHTGTTWGKGPLSKPIAHSTSSRHMDTRPLVEHVETVTRAVRTGSTPVRLGLGEEFRLPDDYDLLAYVADRWAASGPGPDRPFQVSWAPMDGRRSETGDWTSRPVSHRVRRSDHGNKNGIRHGDRLPDASGSPRHHLSDVTPAA